MLRPGPVCGHAAGTDHAKDRQDENCQPECDHGPNMPSLEAGREYGQLGFLRRLERVGFTSPMN